jgi:Mlc titration factor MtfA (ptsG expression regulator)
MPFVETYAPFYRGLAPERQRAFLDKLKVFVWEKHFFGAGGLEMTDEVRVASSIAAVRLVQFLDLAAYDRLTEIVVYPYVYAHPGAGGAILGEAHSFGTVVLAWPAVRQGLLNPADGHDTAAHEFAHVLDRADGAFDGTPELRASEHYRPWAEVLGRRYIELKARAEKKRSVMRAYGATNEAEFFAVATESFFEKPRQLREKSPDLYAELSRFFGCDPAIGPAVESSGPHAIGRNDPCPCGSGRKYKRCCGRSR